MPDQPQIIKCLFCPRCGRYCIHRFAPGVGWCCNAGHITIPARARARIAMPVSVVYRQKAELER